MVLEPPGVVVAEPVTKPGGTEVSGTGTLALHKRTTDDLLASGLASVERPNIIGA